MPSRRTIYTCFSLLFPLVLCGTSREGEISLWSNSACNSKGTTSNFGQQDPIGLNFRLWPDFCGVPGVTVHSYKVNENAICTNGTTARFMYFESDNCTPEPTDENPNPTLSPMRRRQMGGNFGTGGLAAGDLTGLCLALVAYNSFAFVCEGVQDDGFKTVISGSPAPATSSPTSATTSTTSATSSSTSTTTSSISAASSTSTASSSTSPSSDGSSSSTSTADAAATTSSNNAQVVTTSGPTITIVQSQSSDPSPTPSSQPSAAAQSSGSSSGVSAGIRIGCAIGVLGAAALLIL